AKRRRCFLDLQFIQQNLVQQNLANLAINLPDLLVQRGHHTLMLVEYTIGEALQLLTQRPAVELVQRLAPGLLKKTSQKVMQELAGVDSLQIERSFATRLQLEHSLAKESVATICIGAKAAGAVDELATKALVEQSNQVRIRDPAIVRSK